MKAILATLICLGASVSCGAKALSLSECINLGLENNRALLEARLEVGKSRITVTENRSRLLPVINGAFQLNGYMMNPVNVTTGTLLGNDFADDPTWQTIKSMPYNATAGIQLSVPVYNGQLYAAVDVAKAVERIAALSYGRAADDLTVEISRLFYLACSAREQAELLQGNIERMDELYRITEALYEQGVVLEVDLNRININLQNLKAAKGSYDMLCEQRLNMLKYMLDLPPEHQLVLAGDDSNIADTAAGGVSPELPELLMVKEQHSLAERQIKAVKAGYLPSVGLTAYVGGVGYQEKLGDFFHGKPATKNWFGNSFIGLTVNIPIFDANSKKQRINRYKLEARQAENRHEMLQNRLAENYRNALLQLEHNHEVYLTQLQSYRQAESVYNLTAEQYKEGVSSMMALLQDEMQMRTAQSSCVQAHCQFYLARLELLRLSGNLSLLTANNQ